MADGINFRELVSDIKAQAALGGQDWRQLAKRCTDYYDGKQLSAKMIRELARLEMPDIVENLIHAPINSMLGNEAQRRRDWMVQADDDESQEVAEGLNARLNEQLRLTEANSRCSDAYASQVKAGLGWLHVRRNDDPFGSDYKIEFVHRDEIYWDMRDRSQGLDACRWLARRRFMDVDEAKAFLPEKYHVLVDMVSSRWQDPSRAFEFAGNDGYAVDLMYSDWQSVSANIEFVLDSQRRRVAIYEVYYRVFADGLVLFWEDGKRELFDERNQAHLLALMAGQARVERRKFRKMRRKWFVGPHEIMDEASPYPHQLFPYVPFFGYREDDSNVPYGVIRQMIDPQDAYTNATIRIHHILNQKRVIIVGDVTDMTDGQIVDELSRKDGVLRLRKNATGDIRVEQDWEELHKLIALRQSHEQKIRDVAGIYQAFSGKETNGQSGVAIASLAELGAVTLAEINDNYEYGRKKVAELLLAYIVNDIGNKPTLIKVTEAHSQTRKQVVLNQPVNDGQFSGEGAPGGVNNSVVMASYQVTLAPVQSSPGYRQHQHMRLMEMFQASPDTIKMELFPMVIESSEMPRREEFLKKWNEKQGIGGDPEQQQAAKESAMQQQQQEMAMRQAEREAEIGLKQAQAAERKAQAELDQAKAAETLANIERQRAEMQLKERTAKDQLINQTRRQMASKQLASL